MVSKTVLCKVGSVALFLVGAGLFIFGFLVVGTVDDLLKDGVKKSLKLESGDIDAEFLTSSNVKYNAYVYNISNWNDFVNGNALPSYNLLGPYTYQETANKYNTSFSDDGTTFKFNEYFTYVPLSEGINDTVYTANLVFGGVLGGFFQTMQGELLTPASVAAANQLRPDSLLDEPKLLSNVLLPSVHPVVADQFSKRDRIASIRANTFRSFLPATTFKTYVDGFLVGGCGAFTGANTYARIGTQWADASIFPPLAKNCSAGYTGFEIGTAPAAVGIFLFNTSEALSFLTLTGQQAWTAAIAGDPIYIAALNATITNLGGNYTAIRDHMNQFWFNNVAYETTVVTTVSNGLTGRGFTASGGLYGLPELRNLNGYLNATDFNTVLGSDAILTSFKSIWSLANLAVDSLGVGFDKLAALQFSTGALTASGNTSTFLDSTLKGLFGLAAAKDTLNAVQLDGLEYAHYFGQTVYDLYKSNDPLVSTIAASAPGCAAFLSETNENNVTRYLSCVYMVNALSVNQARALLNKSELTSEEIVTWGFNRLNVAPANNITAKAKQINEALKLNGTDPIPDSKIALLSDYFCYRLPLSVYKGRMVLNAGGGDYRTGGLFRKLKIDEVFRGYTDQFVPAAVAPGFFASTLATYTNVEAGFKGSPYTRHEMYTGTADIQKARWWKAFRGISNLTTWEDTWVEDLTVNETTARNTRVNEEVLRVVPRDGGVVWRTSEIIDGTSDGKTAGPFQEDNQVEKRSNLYVSQARRSANLTRSGEVVTFKGIKLIRYRFDVEVVQNSTTNPANEKYYMGRPFNNSQFGCPNGLVPLQRMARGAPVFLSQAGFYNVDPLLMQPYNMTQQLNGATESVQFNPLDKELWDTYLDMEPFSGATMNAHKRLQVNLWLPKTWFIPQSSVVPQNIGFLAGVESAVHANFFRKVANETGSPLSVPSTLSKLFVPVAIYDENGSIQDKDATEFKEKIYDNRDLADNLRIIFIVVGAFFMVCALGCLYHFSRKTGMDRLESKADLTN